MVVIASASDLDKGKYFMYNGQPYRVVRREVVAYGTHSHTKLKFFIEPLSGGGEKIINMAHQENVEILDIIRKSGQVIAKANGKVQVMDMKSYETFDAIIDPQLYDKINENDEVIFVDYNNAATILEKK